MSSKRESDYKTIRKEVSAEIKVEGSRFIASVYRVENRGEVERRLTLIRDQFHDASHNAFAYRLGSNRTVFSFFDDRKPPGTAGRPILRMIDKFGLTNVMVVVTRYFGGTKLGRGGLARAYASAAAAALDKSEMISVCETSDVHVCFPYLYAPRVMQVIASVGGRIPEAEYEKDVKLKVRVPVAKIGVFSESVMRVTLGNVGLG